MRLVLADAHAAALRKRVDRLEGAVGALLLDPFARRADELDRRRHRARLDHDQKLHTHLLSVVGPRVSTRFEEKQGCAR